MSDYEELFNDLVVQDVRGEITKAELQILKNDIRKWLQVLNSLMRNVELQLAAQKARMAREQADYLQKNDKINWLYYKAEEDDRRVRSMRFMVSVEQKIMTVKSLRADKVTVA